MVLPWQTTEWHQLTRQWKEHRLPHAILLTGSEGLGKQAFAQQLASSLLCTSPTADGIACGHCESCKLITAGTHPDLLQLAPETPDKAIKVDDIRGLCRSLTMTSQYEGYKVAVIAVADNMNVNAANSLLKTLEEPGENTLILLVSSRPHRLPITIRSRCQVIKFHAPDAEMAQDWLKTRKVANADLLLQIAHGTPLKALALAEEGTIERRNLLAEALSNVAANRSITEWADKLAQFPSDELLGWLYDWIGDFIRQKAGQQVLYCSDKPALTSLATQIPQTELFSFLDEIVSLKKMQSIPLNTQMFWEDLLISWNRIIKRA